MKRNISKKDFYRLLLWFAGDQSRLLGWIRSNASCGSVTVVRLPWLKRGCRQDLNSTFISLVRSDSEHSHRSCSIPGWIPIPHIKRCFYRFWYDPSGSNPLSVFLWKTACGQGWDLLAIWILFRKSKTFLVVAFWFFAVTEGFFGIIHVRSAVFSDPSI